jgi:NADPH:quinone reductase-like Zn-dependent oxidoreductase
MAKIGEAGENVKRFKAGDRVIYIGKYAGAVTEVYEEPYFDSEVGDVSGMYSVRIDSGSTCAFSNDLELAA